MGRRLAFFLLICIHTALRAATITGTVTDDKGALLSFASIVVKGTSKGAVANSQGKYSIELQPGNYVLVCQFVGYHSIEKNITVGKENQVVNFELSVQELKMDEVIIRRGEDPALEIMRQTIKKRKFYNGQVDSFTVDVYIKGLMRSRSVPDKFFGQKIDKGDMAKDGVDSAGKGILFLSESVTKVAFAKPNKIKYEVVSSRTSGGNGYGLSFPFFINFYENNVQVSNANPRGFISPISENAFHYYKFHYEGNFFEGNRMVDKIRVTPRRKNEPLFSGFIQIVDGEWRIHSLELLTTSEYQLELIDTLRITQMNAPVTENVWRTQNQVVYVAFKKFGFDIAGNFLNVYSNYDLNPGFAKKHFNKIFLTYDSAALKKDSSYWASTRPVPLEPEEKKDFSFKDSVHKAEIDSFSRFRRDSLRKHRQPVKFKNFFVHGVTRYMMSPSAAVTYNFHPLIKELEYNTVEGLVVSVVQSVDVHPRKGNKNINFILDSRYGTSNGHFNAFLNTTIQPKHETYRNRYLLISGGRTISQFNHDNPISPLMNSVYTLFARKNYMKIYEHWVGRIEYNNSFDNGLKWNVALSWEDRFPLENSTDFSFFNKKDSAILPNHPYELASIPFERHQATVAEVRLSYQPGQRYIQYPRYKEPIGSNKPIFELKYTKGIEGLLGSDVNYDKWQFMVSDELNLKMKGSFHYRVGVGGFLNNKKVEIPDFTHFNGNQTFLSNRYLDAFQLAPYYRYSNTETFYAVGHAEHHFNGLITNKIPLFNRLKWNLVAGSNTFYVNRDNYYVEAFAGLENIFKVLRVDFVWAYQAEPGHAFGVRLGFGGIIGGLAKIK